MLVSHTKEFVYTKTVKTASTSVEAYFECFCVADPSEAFTEFRNEQMSENGIVGFRGVHPPAGVTFWNHMPAAILRDRIGHEVWDHYLKFCVVRNPFEKVLSAYYFVQYLEFGTVRQISLDEDRANFEAWAGVAAHLPVDRDKYLIDGRFCMDLVVRHENLAEDLQHICHRLDIPWELERLPRLKTGIRPGGRTPSAMFTESSKRLVESAFRFELDLFGYSFPE